MEIHDPMFCAAESWLLCIASGVSMLIVGAIYLVLG
ncbi:hypothetical protein FHS31_001297 [Sphingomonas vulcanisoli]|uniref:Uncharacterized protein n=1 Tax=Sphingomonas vulcanisoli TaxID=1658060 RepID=A0ABX0TQJ1_9SPHN|nr:hypothetical protein [Sphingomonas vulcanisoli]